jgi:hypothetical protein
LFNPSFSLVFDPAELLAIFPIPVTLTLGFSAFGFAHPPWMAEEQLALVSRGAPIHRLTRNLVVNIPILRADFAFWRAIVRLAFF